jgi:hypothetical protein
MYRPASNVDREVFLEVTNTGTSPVHLAGWRFTSGIAFTFPDIVFPAGQQSAVAAVLRHSLPAGDQLRRH